MLLPPFGPRDLLVLWRSRYNLTDDCANGCAKPVVGHEVECYGQFPAVTRELQEAWNEVASSNLLRSAANMLDGLGLRGEEELWSSASAALHSLTYKLEDEALRQSPGMKGVNHLIFQSEWLSKEGFVG